jgi:hypothetical protein
MIDRTLAAIAANRATFFGMGAAALALAAVLLSAGPSHADVITMTETGFTGSKGNEELTGGTLVVTVTAAPEKDGSYQLKDVTKANAIYTVGTTVYYDYSDNYDFSYTSIAFDFSFIEDVTDTTYIMGNSYNHNGTVIHQTQINDPVAAMSTSPFTVSIVPGSSNLGSASPVPEPGTWMLFGVGVVGIAFARRGRKDRLADL